MKTFLSTPSARRATVQCLLQFLPPGISIHALREEGDVVNLGLVLSKVISIHALREEGDPRRQWLRRQALQFLSTPSARRATP